MKSLVKVFRVWHNKEALKIECNKRNHNIRYVIFRESNLNQILNVSLNWMRLFFIWMVNYLLNYKVLFSIFGPIFLHFWQIFQNGMSHFFENGSITIFHFLLSTVFETYHVYYTILFLAIEFIFTVSLKHIFCLPKKLQWLFFSWLDYKSLLNKFSVLINYSVLGGLPVIFLQPAISHVFHGPGLGSGPKF